MLMPSGRLVAENVYGPTPPLAATAALYGEPTIPPGSDPVVIDRAELTTRFRFTVAMRWVGLEESVAVIATLVVPATVGVPAITPFEMVRPPGRLFAVNVYGPVPPLAFRVTLYSLPTKPVGSVVVVITTPSIT